MPHCSSPIATTRHGVRFSPEGWYSYDLGSWHIVVLNSNCGQVGGCGSASPQAAWLAADLAANPAECTLAYWHYPQFSSGLLSNGSYEVFWQILHDAGADVVLNAHSHHCERFALQDPAGVLNPEHGIRQFVDRPGWTTGSPIAVIIDGSGERVAESFDGESTAAPLLHIEYSLA